MPALKGEDLLTGMLHNRLGRTLLRVCGLSLETPCGELGDLDGLVQTVKHFVLPVTGNMGMEQAQVTAGGIRTTEFNAHTLESRLCPGLYAAGEVLDIDGDCGGYNLQWAWSSGRLAGMLKGSL
jgi:predicted flavoprotein YhiN